MLAPFLDLLLAGVPPALVDDEARGLMRRKAAAMAPIPRIAVECRLGSNAQVDLQQGVRAIHGEAQILRAYLSSLSDPAEGLRKLRRFCDAWTADGSILRGGVEEIFLEYDLPQNGDPVDVPGVFLSLPEENPLEVAELALTLLHDEPPSPELMANLKRCFGACRWPARPAYMGVLLNRGGNWIRLNVKRLRPDDLNAFLEAIGWDGDRVAASDALRRTADQADRVTIALDVGAVILPRIGFECYIDPEVSNRRRWGDLLSSLEAKNLCSPEKSSALLAVPGELTPPQTQTPWHPSWVAASLLQPANLFTCAARRLYHVKLTLSADSSWEAKAYFGAGHMWLTPTKEGSREIVPQTHAAAEAVGTMRPKRSLLDAIDRAVDALVLHQGQNGFWRDFELLDTSDEWVTAFVGLALAQTDTPPASDAAAYAFASLIGRQRASGGWGYDANIVPDADSTAWALRLAARQSGLDTEAARKGLRFLERHVRDAGVATYGRDVDVCALAQTPAGHTEEGWKQAHICVTAAAAPLLNKDVLTVLANAQKEDGHWEGYWWRNDYYATALAAEALAGAEIFSGHVDKATAWARRASADALNDFDAAWVLRLLILGRNDLSRARAQNLVEKILERQRKDGRWNRSALARLPMPQVIDPAAGGAITPFKDHNGLFTTAAVLASLALWRDHAHEY